MSMDLSYVDAVAVDVSVDDQVVTGASAIHVGGAGTVALVLRGVSIGNPLAASVQFTCVAGETLRVHFVKVLKTGTSATGLTALLG